MWSCECLSGVAWVQERTQNLGLNTMYLYQERWKELNVSTLKKKKKGVSYGTFIIVQLPCFESITAVQKALTYLQYTSISISWHLNDIRTPDSLK